MERRTPLIAQNSVNSFEVYWQPPEMPRRTSRLFTADVIRSLLIFRYVQHGYVADVTFGEDKPLHLYWT